MKGKILDFRLFLTVVLVVVCFLGDKFSSFNIRETGIQNLTFTYKKQNDITKVDGNMHCTSDFYCKENQSVIAKLKFIKYNYKQAVKEQP